ncbi:MAG TPA: leucine--tRNA ligase, partial [Xanthomonadales bacterium]|nr:leucine--tRNA ligase [Xanthomonadales bacterium]
MDERYYPERVEADARKFWDDTRAFRVKADPDREKFYCLSMFPYPSGRLHMGHVRNYTIGDVISRYQRMQGKNVLQPMGWDAFGLPAENAAIQNNVPAAKWTYENIDYMRAQLKRMGFAYDWNRELATCDPDYYRWEQWLLTRLFEKGLMYKRMAEVNWDPVEQTVLANEQVDSEGRGWRSGALVERREIPHWFLKITDYAEELLAELDNLDGWPDEVRKMQRDWIGRSEGLEVDFGVEGSEQKLRIYTTRPDTLFGVTFMAVAAAHPIALDAARENPALSAFIEECRTGQTSEAALETMEKRGMRIGVNAINPLNGEAVPVFAANYVLMGYGTGAIMGVPGHDFRDHEFAREHGLEIRQVVAPVDGGEIDIQSEAFVSYDIVTVDSGEFSGLSFNDAFERLGEWVEARGIGTRTVRYRLRDWGISRQRYWGCPVPMVHCESCGEVPVPDADLPVVLPEDVEHVGHGSPLARMPEFLDTTCPKCGGKARRETDTLDTFVESSWYYARFVCPADDGRMLDDTADYWLPVDQYVGGIEHAVLHLLYARFFHKLLRDVGLVSSAEPFTNLLTQGMVVAETFYREDNGKLTYFSPADVAVKHDAKGKAIGAKLRSDGQPVTVGRVEKMSKSKNNGVDPQTMVDKYGADTVRLYTMFAAPPDQSLEWSDSSVEGAFRFLRTLWRLTLEHVACGPAAALDPAALSPGQKDLRRHVHETIAKVSDDISRRYKFNTAIASVMELLNHLSRAGSPGDADRAVRQEGLETVILLLAPIVPHVAQVLWRALGHSGLLADAPWPQVDTTALARDSVDLVVQVNGRKRAIVRVA